MKTSVEEISGIRKKLIVEVEPSRVDQKLDAAFNDLKKRVDIPGFRKGKAPRNVLEGRFGRTVEDDVARELISETLPEALQDQKLEPLDATVLEKGSVHKGGIFRYAAELELKPSFEVRDYLGVEVEEEPVSITEADVDQAIEKIREGNGTLKTVEEDRGVAANDHILVDYEAFVGVSPISDMKETDALVKLDGEGRHPEFGTQLLGLKKGDVAELTVEYPANFLREELAGKTVRFSVSVKEIKALKLPDLDDAFVQGLEEGLHSVAELRERLREIILNQEKDRVAREHQQRVIQKIADGVDIPVPASLVQQEIQKISDELQQNLLQKGSSLEKMGVSQEKLQQRYWPLYEQRVKEKLVLAQIMHQESIELEESELEEGLRQLAAQNGQEPETFRKYSEARGIMDVIKGNLAEQKALNYLVAHASFSETPSEGLQDTRG